MNEEAVNFPLTINLKHSHYQSFNTKTIDNSSLDSSFKKDLLDVFDKIRKIPRIWLSFTLTILIVSIVALLAMVSVAYFFPYIIIVFWVLLLSLFYFMDYQSKGRARVVIRVTELLEAFRTLTGNLFLVNVRLSFSQKTCFFFKTSLLEVTIRCHKITLAEPGPGPLVVNCGTSSLLLNSVHIPKGLKKNKVCNIYTIDKLNIEAYNEKTPQNRKNSELEQNMTILSDKNSHRSNEYTVTLTATKNCLKTKNNKVYSSTDAKVKIIPRNRFESSGSHILETKNYALNFKNSMGDDLSNVILKDNEARRLRSDMMLNNSFMGREPLKTIAVTDVNVHNNTS